MNKELIHAHGTYVGHYKLLRGKRAIIKYHEGAATCTAQFDDLSLPHVFTHGWILQSMKSFELDVK